MNKLSQFNKSNPILTSIFSGIILAFAWYIHPILTFIGFVPLLYQIDNENISTKKLFLSSYTFFIVWNIATTWWIVNSTWIGAFLAYSLNSLFMCIPILIFRKILTSKLAEKTNKNYLKFSFIFLWLSFEYLHMQWDLTWPWINLGNTFANAHYLIQWYEFTGALGGSAWILVINILIYNSLIHKSVSNYIKLTIAISLPILISLATYILIDDKGNIAEVVVVQPNIDPYKEKFYGCENFIPYEKQLDILINLSKQKLTQNTTFLFWPETSIPKGFDEDLMSTQPEIFKIKDFLAAYPNLSLISGADTYKIYMKEFDKLSTSRYQEGVGWYDYFNSAVFINPKSKLQFYHKSKLVPGVECMPFPYLTKYLNSMAGDVGFIPGSLGTQEERSVFRNKEKIAVAPIICYESIFGEFVSKYVQNGANLLTIVTNDGWWGNTPGHVQHLAFARLRAIETRRHIARAANTGISCVVNQKGDLDEITSYWKSDARRFNVNLNTENTFYVQFGDYLGKISVTISLILLFITFVYKILF